jgi:hypothetical protein
MALAPTRALKGQTAATGRAGLPAERVSLAKAALRPEVIVPSARNAPARVTFVNAVSEQLEAHPSSGAATSVNGGATSVNSGKLTVVLPRNGQVGVRRTTASPEVVDPLSTTKQSLQGTLLVGVTDAQNRTSAKQLQPFIAAEHMPLRWDARTSAYVTTMLVGLDPVSDDGGPPLTLPEQVVFQITGRNIDRIEPNQVTIQSSGPAGYKVVRLVATSFAPPAEINAHSIAGDGTFRADIDPGPTWIDVTASDQVIDGLGFGITTITATQHAANGMLLPVSSPLNVSLRTTRGELRPNHADIAVQHSSADVSLVSAWVGDGLVADANALDPSAHPAWIHFAFPWLKIVLGLLGAFAAGALRAWRAQASRGLMLLTCGATGIVVDILLALGAPIAPAWALQVIRSELAWLAFGFLAGFPGGSLLERLTGVIFGLRQPKSAAGTAS